MARACGPVVLLDLGMELSPTAPAAAVRAEPSKAMERWDLLMRKLGIAGVLAVALALTGCGSGSDDGGGNAISGEITVLTQRTAGHPDGVVQDQ